MSVPVLAQSQKLSLGRAAEVLLPVALLFACAARPPAPDGPPLQHGTLDSAGRTRTFLYFRPEGPGPFPLVLALHGRLGDGAGQDRLSHLSPLARDEKFVLLLPDGYRESWHDARNFGPAAEAGIDDVKFLSELLDWAVGNLGADASRLYVMGMSNGALMANTLACRLGSRLAGIGAVTGGISDNLARDCAPDRAPSVALVMGTADPLVPYGGGQVGGNRGGTLSAEASAQKWAGLCGCTGEPDRVELPDRDPDDGTRTSLYRFRGCTLGREVRLYRVEGGGHTWPGGWKYLGEWLVGKVARDFDASVELWSFLEAQRAPEH